ncbi:MAG: hypothetical protein MR922_09565, partial [Lachnospiraceae bacterium]|nr:hypothetical protein [Lachnospiraceae bacterium]
MGKSTSGYHLPLAKMRFSATIQYPIFDSFLGKKVSQATLRAACGTFINFTDARYTIYFLVWEQIFLILA